MMSSSGRSSSSNRFPFTASQWQELEHQALVFKYMVSGIPIPPDLLFTIRTSLDSSLSSKFLVPQPHHIGWNSFQMGFGRKIDPEPGRCRRTDGKKWRCSKEAYPDSKYCERHMHRGRNRSRKPVEILSPTPTTTPPPPSSTPSPLPYLSQPPHFLSPHFSSSNQDTTNFFLDSHLHSPPPPKHCRNSSYGHGSDERAFFSEADAVLTLMGSSASQIKHYNYETGPPAEQPKKVMHHFIDEWATKEKDSDRTQLSISIPNSSLHDFFITHKWYSSSLHFAASS